MAEDNTYNSNLSLDDIVFENTTYVGSEIDLDSAKKLAETFIRNKSEELTKFVSFLL